MPSAAMIDWCNEQGGINGRKIKGNQYDAAYMQSAKVVQESCKKDFMLVGQGFAMDEAAEQYRVACKLPTVAGFTIGPNAAMGPMKYEAVPYPVDLLNIGGLPRRGARSPTSRRRPTSAVTSPAVSTGTGKIAGAMKGSAPTPLECGVRLNDKGESSYMPFAEKIKECGARRTCGHRLARPRPVQPAGDARAGRRQAEVRVRGDLVQHDGHQVEHRAPVTSCTSA